MSEKTDREPQLRQAGLPFDGGEAADVFPSSSPACQGVEPAAGDVEAELAALSDTALRQRFEELRASRDKRLRRLVEMFAAMGLLAERGLLTPRVARHALPVEAPAAVKGKRPAARSRQLRTMLERLVRWATPVEEEALVNWLEQELGSGRRQELRRIVGAVRDGAVPHGLIVVAHRRAKRRGIHHPAACFVRYIVDRSTCIRAAMRR